VPGLHPGASTTDKKPPWKPRRWLEGAPMDPYGRL
jgi:hypothetical protein